MAGSPNKFQLDDNDVQDIWDLVSKSTRDLPTPQPNPRNESLSMPTPAPDGEEDGFSVGGILDIVGTLLSGPRAGPAAVVGGGVEAGKQLYQHATGSPDAPQSTTEAAKRIGTKAAEYGVGTKAGQKVGELIGAAGRKIFQKPMTPEAKQVQEFAAQGMPYQGQQMAPQNMLPMTPAKMTENNIYQVLDNVSQGSIFGSGSLSKFEGANEELTKRTIEKFADTIGKNLNKEELGQMFVMLNRGNLQIARAPATALYNAIEKQVAPKMVERTVLKPHPVFKGADGKPIMVAGKAMEEDGGAFIDMRPLKTWAQGIVKSNQEVGGAGRDLVGADMAKKIMGSNDFVSYQAAKDFRTEARAIAEEFAITNKKAPAIGLAKKAEGALTKQIDEGLGRFDPAIQAQWRIANRIYAQASSKYDNTFVRHLIKVATQKEGGLPEQVYGMIIKPQGINMLRRAKTAINVGTKEGQDLWNSFGEKTLLSSIEQATDKSTKHIDMQKLHNSLFGKTDTGESAGLGIKALRELYTSDQIDWIRKAVNMGIQQQKGRATDVGGMLVQMKTGGALAAIIGAVAGTAAGGASGGLAAAGGILLGPEVIARVMTSPSSAKWFVKGMTTPANSMGAKEVQKKLRETLGLAIGSGALTVPGRIFVQQATEDYLSNKTDKPYQGLSLPPIADQLQR